MGYYKVKPFENDLVYNLVTGIGRFTSYPVSFRMEIFFQGLPKCSIKESLEKMLPKLVQQCHFFN